MHEANGSTWQIHDIPTCRRQRRQQYSMASTSKSISQPARSHSVQQHYTRPISVRSVCYEIVSLVLSASFALARVREQLAGGCAVDAAIRPV